MIVSDQLTKTYPSGDSVLTVLKEVSFEITPGSFVSILGPSGSGKSTLLGLLAGLDRPSSGSVSLNGQNLTGMTEDQLSVFRNKTVGFVFQSFQLIPTLTALENVMVPLELLGDRNAGGKAADLLEKVGIYPRRNHFPSQLSGGEQQRVALARAFSTSPKILFADEPTGNLDQKTGGRIFDLLGNLNVQHGTTLVMVTHDQLLAGHSDRILRLADGELVSDERLTDRMRTI